MPGVKTEPIAPSSAGEEGVAQLFRRDSPPPPPPGLKAGSSRSGSGSRASSRPATPPYRDDMDEGSGSPKEGKAEVKDAPEGASGSGFGYRQNGSRKKSHSLSHRPSLPLIDHLPSAWDAAHETFETLERCVYETKRMGLSREQDEMMVCDCVYDREDPDADPCGPQSDCINRAIFIECLADECRAGRHCHNQRFAKRQFADLEIVQTEMKGFGLRAGTDFPSGTLIYEYIGEVVVEKTFRKRMARYAEEGIRHFYFMMLQKEEYIDATKKGGIGRFANHSCNPNCEVQKWVVGRRLRMGIFTKRNVVKGEEITFNYNVDRYGHDAQVCYCGEPNCVGFIGGKTQTDIGGMGDLFLDALGITDEVEAMEMKGSKKKKSRKLDEDFVPTLHPMQEHEVQKVAIAMRQSMENPKMMSRLLQRIRMTAENAIHRQFMRMHGFSLMSMILSDMGDDREIVLLALESMETWKLQIRNKIEDSKVEEPVKALAENGDADISALAKKLLEYWSGLELSYRIPRVSKIPSLDAEDDATTTTIAEANASEHRRPQTWENDAQIKLEFAPVRARPPPAFARPRPPPPAPPPKPVHSVSADRLKLDAIIALAQQTVAATAAAKPMQSPAASAAAESSRSGSRTLDDTSEADAERRKRLKRSHASSKEGEEERKERRLTKLVGEVVVRSMTKYKEQMEHEVFKRYAKECTLLLVDKEKKGHSYSKSRNPTLDDDKKAKMKAFTKEYTHKLLKRLKEKERSKSRKMDVNGSANGHRESSSASASSARRDRNGNGHGNDAIEPDRELSSSNSRTSPHDPAASPSMSATPAASLLDSWTPSARGSVSTSPTADRHDSSADLVADIFGADDPDDEMDADEVELQGASGDVQASPGGASTPGLDRTPLDEEKARMRVLEKTGGGPEGKWIAPPPAFAEVRIGVGAMETPRTPSSQGLSPVDHS